MLARDRLGLSAPQARHVGGGGLPRAAPHPAGVRNRAVSGQRKSPGLEQRHPAVTVRTDLLEHLMSTYYAPAAVGTRMQRRLLSGGDG